MGAPDEGASLNGHDRGEIVASQRSRFPYLEAFSARGRFAAKSAHPDAYVIALGLRIGLATGKTFELTLPRGAPGNLVADILRKTAAALDALVADCAAQGGDIGDQLPADQVARLPKKGESCALCDSPDPLRWASCRRTGCPCAAARAAAPISLEPGAAGAAVAAAFEPSTVTLGPNPPAVLNGQVADARGHAYSPDCGCGACSQDRAERAANEQG